MKKASLPSPVTWSRALLYSLIAISVIFLIWACVARIGEVIPAQGKLEPKGNVRELQAPVGGVVEQVVVKNGNTVRANQLLIRIDPKVVTSEITALQGSRDSLESERRFYKRVLAGEAVPEGPDLPVDMESLAKERTHLVAENRLRAAQAGGPIVELAQQHKELLAESERERISKIEEARLRADGLNKELTGLRSQLEHAEKIAATKKEIFERYRKLETTGGVSKVDFLARKAEYDASESEVSRLSAAVKNAEVEIERTTATVANLEANFRKLALDDIEENNRRIAEIDAQLSKVLVETEKKLGEISASLVDAETRLGYHDILAPADGIVFDIEAKQAGAVVNAGQTLLKIVPDGELVAEVYLTNRDIGFVREGMEAIVRVDTFPFREFGEIKGTVDFIGSDALPPDEQYPFFRFPATITLDRQHLVKNGRELPLKSGMSVTCNLQVRKRTLIAIFLDVFGKPMETLETVR